MANDTQPQVTAPVPDEQQFAEGDATQLYGKMRPDQRTAVGNEFLRLLQLTGDTSMGDREATGELSAEQVAKIHSYARERHPEILHDVWGHPVTQASLAAPGAEAEPVEHEEAIEATPIDVEEDYATTPPPAPTRDDQWESLRATQHADPDIAPEEDAR